MDKIKKLIGGEIYSTTDIDGYIFKVPIDYDKTNNSYEYYINDERTYSKSTGSYNWNLSKTRLATTLEKAWLNECIKQNKFVPKDQIKVDEVINDYQIY